MDTGGFAEALVILVLALDPPGGAPAFLVATAEMSPPERNRAALGAAVLTGAALLFLTLIGDLVTRQLDVELEAVLLAGGATLLLRAVGMLGAPGGFRRGGTPALAPLTAAPLALPAAVAAALALTRRHPVGAGRAGVLLGALAALVLLATCLRGASWAARWLPAGALDLATRIMGLLLAAIAVQMVIEAVARWQRVGVG